MSEALLGDRYEILDRLGTGGMGTVYRARDTRLLREVAVKVLTIGAEESEDDLLSFHREARAVAALQHPNIVQIFDYSGPSELPPYIVMELVDGGNIEQVCEQRGMPAEVVVVSIAASVAAALSHAHQNGVIHRDIKPLNVMVTSSGRALLTDFGLAKAYDDPKRLGTTVAERVTALFGTPAFVAPEQVEEETSGPDSDVFSLGSVIYWLATGASPFYEKDPVKALRRILVAEYQPLDRVRPDLSADLCTLVSGCLQLEPVDRPTAVELKDKCSAWLAQRGVPDPATNIEKFLRGEQIGDQHADTTVVVPDRREHEEPRRADPRREEPRREEPPPVAREPSSAETEIHTVAASWGQVAPRDSPTAEPSPALVVDRSVASPPSRSVSPLLIGALAAVVLGATGAALVLLSTDGGEQGRVQAIVLEPQPPTPTPVPQPLPTPVEPTAPVPVLPEPVVVEPVVEPAVQPESETVEPEKDLTHKRRRRAKKDPVGLTHVKIIVEPWGTVFLDGKKLGNTPLVHEIRASAGPHHIAVEHPSKGRVERTVQFGRQKKVYFNLSE